MANLSESIIFYPTFTQITGETYQVGVCYYDELRDSNAAGFIITDVPINVPSEVPTTISCPGLQWLSLWQGTTSHRNLQPGELIAFDRSELERSGDKVKVLRAAVQIARTSPQWLSAAALPSNPTHRRSISSRFDRILVKSNTNPAVRWFLDVNSLGDASAASPGWIVTLLDPSLTHVTGP